MSPGVRTLLLLCLLTVAAVPATGLAPCPRGWLSTASKCLRVSRYIRRSALASRMACRGLHYAAIPFRPLTGHENRMASLLVRTARAPAAWLAYYRLRGWRDYRWVNTRGRQGYHHRLWRPKTSSGQQCVTLSARDGRWTATRACQRSRPHICELCRYGQVGCICRGPQDCRGTRGARCSSRGICQCSGGLQYDSAGQQCAACPRGWRLWRDPAGRRHCYLLPRADRVTVSWRQAVYLGRRVGAALEPRRFVHLLSVTSAAEARTVRRWLSADTQLVWLGLHGSGINSWRWQSGELVRFTAWARRGMLQEPNGRTERDNCAVWANFAAAGYGWADLACNGRYRAYPAFEFEY